MSKSKITLPFNYLHYYAIAVLIGLLAAKNLLLIALYIPFYKLIRSYSHKRLVLIVGFVVVGYSLLYPHLINQKPQGNRFKVVNKIEKDEYYLYYVKNNYFKYSFSNKKELLIGDIVVLDFTTVDFIKERTPNGFNEFNYYRSKGIVCKLKVSSIEVVENKFHLNQLKEKLKRTIGDFPPSTKKHLMLFGFGEDIFEQDLKEAKIKLGIVHLFSLSGMHINIIIGAVNLLCKKLKIKEDNKAIFGLLVVYLWLSSFSLSLLRAVLMYIVYQLFKDQGITKLDSLAIAFIVMIFINPYFQFRSGFVLSFLVSFLLVISPFKKTIKDYLLKHFNIFIMTLLLVANINGGIYVVSFFTSLIYTLLFPVLIMPVIFLSIVPFLRPICEMLLDGFELSMLELALPLKIKFPHQNIYSILGYLTIFGYYLFANTNKQRFKRISLIVFYLGSCYFSFWLDFNGRIYFLDVGQGDSTFIQRPFNQANILIDAHTGTYNFLNTLGDIEIDCFFITHGDFDHASEAITIIEEFKVKEIYLNPYDQTEIAKSLQKYKPKIATKGQNIKCGDVNIKVLGPLKNYYCDNNNSLVLQMTIDNKEYLFTGDIEKEAELDLVEYYQSKLKSDILHVAHHGSSTSSHVSFLNYVLPKEAIISVGLNNYYNHPHHNTINNLKNRNIDIYLTSEERTIIKKKYKLGLPKRLYKLKRL